MWPNPQFPVGLVTFTGEILNGKLHFLCSVSQWKLLASDLFLKLYLLLARFLTIVNPNTTWVNITPKYGMDAKSTVTLQPRKMLDDIPKEQEK